MLKEVIQGKRQRERSKWVQRERERKFHMDYSHKNSIQGSPLGPEKGLFCTSPDSERKLEFLISTVQQNSKPKAQLTYVILNFPVPTLKSKTR